ncbi:MAG TPA: hypothetical protein VFN67_33795 [Polyangiales bacterium]|nr:hypothetical protein [Polyangiales bacterium]
MSERIFTRPMSVHCTADEIAEIDRAAAAVGTSRNKFVKSTLKHEIERLARLQLSAASTQVEAADSCAAPAPNEVHA